MEDFSKDLTLIGNIEAVPTMLDVICRTTGMGFAAVARVTERRWIACAVEDSIQFGLKAGGELEIETTICHEICQSHEMVVINNVAEDETYSAHHTPLQYGFQSYISVPIMLPGGEFYGTLCAIDPKPAALNTPAVIGMFKMFADLISFHIDAAEKLAISEYNLHREQENSMLREQFIAVLSHDLRSPLNAITMGTALLKEDELEGRQNLLVDMMDQGAARMLGLIEDVMDFAHGRLGQGIVLERMSVSEVRPLLDQIIGETTAKWPDREIQMLVQLDGPFSHDAKRLGQLVANLLSNAMSHGTAEQPVTVEAKILDGKFHLSVSNAAEPIPEQVRERLFEPFFRGLGGGNKQGLGLGLYIASQIAKAHGGTLEVESNEKHTRFVFSMPA